jgi:hypothetical protein
MVMEHIHVLLDNPDKKLLRKVNPTGRLDKTTHNFEGVTKYFVAAS